MTVLRSTLSTATKFMEMSKYSLSWLLYKNFKTPVNEINGSFPHTSSSTHAFFLSNLFMCAFSIYVMVFAENCNPYSGPPITFFHVCHLYSYF